jgi:hypothetical protein
MASRRFFQAGTFVLFGFAMLKVAKVSVGIGRTVGAIDGSVTIRVGAALIVGTMVLLCGIQLDAAGTSIREAITTKIGMAINLFRLRSLNPERSGDLGARRFPRFSSFFPIAQA